MFFRLFCRAPWMSMEGVGSRCSSGSAGWALGILLPSGGLMRDARFGVLRYGVAVFVWLSIVLCWCELFRAENVEEVLFLSR